MDIRIDTLRAIGYYDRLTNVMGVTGIAWNLLMDVIDELEKLGLVTEVQVPTKPSGAPIDRRIRHVYELTPKGQEAIKCYDRVLECFGAEPVRDMVRYHGGFQIGRAPERKPSTSQGA